MEIMFDPYLFKRRYFMNSSIIIASDSTTDLGAELIEKYGIKIIPLGVSMSGQEYTDGVDVTPDMIYENYEKTGELPKTSAANIAEFEDFFAASTKDGSSVVLFTISSQMSSTYHNACLAAENYDNVYVIDTKNLSTGGGLMVVSACEMAESGMSAKEIADTCNSLSERIDASFVIDSLEFLYKGGRCSALAALGANLLKLKPCIVVRDGKMSVGKKYRGAFASVLTQYVNDKLADADDIELDHIFITHAGCDECITDAVKDQVRNALPFKNIHFTRAGCTISSHCGRNTLGILFIRKNKISCDQ